MEMQISAPAPTAPMPPMTVTENVGGVPQAQGQGANQNQQPAGSQVPQSQAQGGAVPQGNTEGVKPQSEGNAEAPQPADENSLSARFAALAKREKAIVDREKKAQELGKKYEPLIQSLAKFKEDPVTALDAMEAEGVTFEMLAQAYLKRKDPNAQPTAEDKYAELQKRLDAIEQEKKDNALREAQAKEAQAVDAFKGQIKSFVESGGEKYELIQAQNAIDVVYDVIEQHYQKTGEIMDVATASDHVENHLYEEGKRLLAIKKFGFQPPTSQEATPQAPQKPASAAEAIAQGVKPQSPTLSTRDVPPASTPPSSGLLSREESIRLAASKLKFQ